MGKSEADVCYQQIEPAIQAVGWERNQVRREVTYTAGQIFVRGKLTKRGKKKRADYILYHKQGNIPLAVIEAKRASKDISAGLQQGLDYAEDLDIPFVFSSNGKGFLFQDRTGLTEGDLIKTLAMEEFPRPEVLWELYKQYKKITEESDGLITYPNHMEIGGKEPRYYQQIAINRTIEAISRGQRRVMCCMATGCGKTYTLFQIIWRLWKTRRAKRILFLADRNILVDQTKNNDFAPFGNNAMVKVSKKLVDENGTIDTSREIYLALYQALVGGEVREDLYKKFPRDFFDLVCIDECHRGSASEDSQWRCVLDHFDSAIHIGLTATPRETETASNSHYFGDPVYTYSLQQGIKDGFLAPFKVIRVDLDKDLQGWRPEKNQTDKHGQEIEDRVYNQRDFDRTLVLEGRRKRVAEVITTFLHGHNVYSKAIVFCEDVEHAQGMKVALINEPRNKKLVLENSKYVMRITGDDDEGKAQLDNFIDPMKRYPVIATTSRLMSTGVDAKTCELIVLDRRIQSMTEFKQIIGRGTRVLEEKGKLYFTILDFRKVTELFADPEWDGPPLQVYEPTDENPTPPEEDTGHDGTPEDDPNPDVDWEVVTPTGAGEEDSLEESAPKKYVIDNVEVTVVAERVQYYGSDGKLIMESLRDYTRKTIRKNYSSLDQFIKRWSEEDRKSAIIDELLEQGVLIESLEEHVGTDKDPFDLICHVAFDQPPLTRRERVQNVRKRDVFTKYGEQARKVLEALLEKYADEGITNIEDVRILRLDPFTELGTAPQIIRSFFGGKQGYEQALKELEQELYKQVG